MPSRWVKMQPRVFTIGAKFAMPTRSQFRLHVFRKQAENTASAMV